MVDIAPFCSGRCTARPADWSVHRHQVDHECPKTQVMQADVRAPPIPSAAEDLDIEIADILHVANAEDDMID